MFKISVTSKRRAVIISISKAMRSLRIIVVFCVICALNAAHISKRALMYELGAINPGNSQRIIVKRDLYRR